MIAPILIKKKKTNKPTNIQMLHLEGKKKKKKKSLSHIQKKKNSNKFPVLYYLAWGYKQDLTWMTYFAYTTLNQNFQ